jgi:hypothetical protein
MRGYWEFQTETRVTFRIAPDKGRYVIYCGTRALGSYFSAEQAVEDLVGGSLPELPPPTAQRLGLPSDLNEWDFFRVSERLEFIAEKLPTAGSGRARNGSRNGWRRSLSS